MRLGVYCRVSTTDQNCGMQLDALRQYAIHRGWTIHAEYVDEGFSGAKMKRPALTKLLDDARKGLIDGVACWRFDRIARSTKHLLSLMHDFRARKILFVSYMENIDTSTPMGEAMFTILAAFAQLERDIIRERVAAGIARARLRKQNTTWGRPPIHVPDIPSSVTLRQAQEITGISRETIRRRRLKAAKDATAQSSASRVISQSIEPLAHGLNDE